MLTGRDALVFLERSLDGAERRSSYWDQEQQGFTIDADGRLSGRGPIGNVSRKTGWPHAALHWGLQTPYRWIARRFRAFPRIQRTGRAIARRQGRQFTEDMLRQVLALAQIAEHVRLEALTGVAVVIGDGYGVMSALLRLAAGCRPVVAVNLTKQLLADLAFARMAIPGATVAVARDAAEIGEAMADPKVDVIGVRADDWAVLAEAPIALAVNIHSMQEMIPDAIADYFRVLRANRAAETAFYCCNRVEKTLYRGEVIRFQDYPWRVEDTVLLDGICPWDRIEYGPRPPFWSLTPNLKRHRLAVLARGEP